MTILRKLRAEISQLRKDLEIILSHSRCYCGRCRGISNRVLNPTVNEKAKTK